MARKTEKSKDKKSDADASSTIKRTKSMKETLAAGEQYLKQVEESSKKKTSTRAAASTTKTKKVSPAKKATTVKKSPAKKATKVASSTKKITKSKPAPAVDKKSPKKGKVDKKDSNMIEEKPSDGSIKEKTGGIKRQLSMVPKYGMIDVVFCMDTTGSMGSYIIESKKAATQIIKKISERVTGSDVDLKFGFVAYRDHPASEHGYITKVQDLCNANEIQTFISSLDASGGGDFPEAVMDGLMDSCKKISWRDSFVGEKGIWRSVPIPNLRYIFHIGDAPPHGPKYSYSTREEPSGITASMVAHQINRLEIHYRVIKVNNSLDKFTDEMKKLVTNYDEAMLNKANELNVKMGDMIIRELVPDYA